MRLKQHINEGFITNDDSYPDNSHMFHTTTESNMILIKQNHRIIPTDHMFFGKLYKQRLHLSDDKRSHVRMVTAIKDERPEWSDERLFTFIISWPSDLSDPDYSEYKDLQVDNNAFRDGHTFFTNSSVNLDRVLKIMEFSKFITSPY